MVKNREELLAASNEWMKIAISDLRNRLIEAMERLGTDSAELSYALGISENELEGILHGRTDIALSTFAKILISTDNVIEIKPIEATPFKSIKNIPVSGAQRKVPIRDRYGRFAKAPASAFSNPSVSSTFGNNSPIATEEANDIMARHGIPTGMPRPVRFGGMPGIGKTLKRQDCPKVSRRTLISTITDNGWYNEIDITNSTDNELTNFLMRKGFTPQHFKRMLDLEATSLEDARPSVQVAEQPSVSLEERNKIAEVISKEIARNPHLAQIFKKYVD